MYYTLAFACTPPAPFKFMTVQYCSLLFPTIPYHTLPLCYAEVKAYVTLNTLVFDHELFDSPSDVMRAGSGSAIEALRLVAEAKVDALIVQDIGLALAPCHQSWQLPAGVSPASKQLGVDFGSSIDYLKGGGLCVKASRGGRSNPPWRAWRRRSLSSSSLIILPHHPPSSSSIIIIIIIIGTIIVIIILTLRMFGWVW